MTPFFMDLMAHLVLHPHGFAPTFLKLDLLSPGGGGFIPIISIKGINLIKKGNCKKKKTSFMHIKNLLQLKNMGAIPCGRNSTSTISTYMGILFIFLI